MRLTRLHGHVQTEGRQLRTLIGHLSGIDTLATAVVWRAYTLLRHPICLYIYVCKYMFVYVYLYVYLYICMHVY